MQRGVGRRRSLCRYAGSLLCAVRALVFAPLRRYSIDYRIAGALFHTMMVFFALLRRYLYNRAGDLFRTAPALSFLHRRGDLWHCACAPSRALPAPSFALRWRDSSRCAGTIFLTAGSLFRAAPALSYVDRQGHLWHCAGALFCASPALFFAYRWRSLSRGAGALPPA